MQDIKINLCDKVISFKKQNGTFCKGNRDGSEDNDPKLYNTGSAHQTISTIFGYTNAQVLEDGSWKNFQKSRTAQFLEIAKKKLTFPLRILIAEVGNQYSCNFLFLLLSMYFESHIRSERPEPWRIQITRQRKLACGKVYMQNSNDGFGCVRKFKRRDDGFAKFLDRET